MLLTMRSIYLIFRISTSSSSDPSPALLIINADVFVVLASSWVFSMASEFWRVPMCDYDIGSCLDWLVL